jgi:diguanylate cyclase (GGDEF)-like protein
MVTLLDRRSLLLACERQERLNLKAVLDAPLFRAWEVREADSIEQTRFLLQMAPCDVLVLDSALYRDSSPEAVSWLTAREETAILLLGEPEAGTIVNALRNGARQWLPRELALRQPAILEATLQQIALVGDVQRKARAASQALHDSRRQVSRLVSLLWDSVPGDGRRSWFPQRHMLERLEEEVERSRRHSETLSVVLGEISHEEGAELSPEVSGQLAAWTVSRVTDGKRRCDVAGQYGPNGFLLLLPKTVGAGAIHCCQRIQSRLEATTEALPAVRAFFGVASLSAETGEARALLCRAEERLERAKIGPCRIVNS